MADANSTTAYVETSEFRQAMEDIKKQIAELSEILDARLTKHGEEILEQANKRLEDALKHEREAHHRSEERLEDELESVSRRADQANRRLNEADKKIDKVAEQTAQKLSQMDTKIDTISSGVSEMKNEFGKLSGIISGWQRAVDTHENSINTLRDNLDSLFRTQREHADAVSMRQQEHSNTISALRVTIHGNADEDGPESIFGMLKNITKNIQEVKTTADSNHALITSIEKERTEEQKRRRQRWSEIKGIGKSIATNPVVVGFAGVAIITLIVALFPDVQEFAQWALEQFIPN